jgi:hypothetical protein
MVEGRRAFEEAGAIRELQRAMLHRVAYAHAIDLLSIKGEVAERMGLRPARAKGDVDVWCRPESLHAFLRSLGALGWERAPRTRASLTLSGHAVTVFHGSWQYTADIHSDFPGFLFDPAHTFDELWAGAAAMRFAGVSCPVPNVNACVLFAFLNGVRAQPEDRASIEAHSLAVAISRSWKPLEKDALATAAHRLGADGSAPQLLRTALGDHRITAMPSPSVSRSSLSAWTMQVSHSNVASAQVVRTLATSPLREWPRIVRNLLFAPRVEYLADHPDAPKGIGLTAHRFGRLFRGLATLPNMVCQLLRDPPHAGSGAPPSARPGPK